LAALHLVLLVIVKRLAGKIVCVLNATCVHLHCRRVNSILGY